MALTALYYLENKLSNFMKSCFKIYAVLHTFASSPCLLASALCMLAHPLRPPLPPAGDKVLTAQAKKNNKLKAFSYIIKLPMRVIPISILNKTFLN
uniref:Uncharacterized protein n=1 Tax=Klebsiella pneumoniae TaxID=573 RepID=A0A483QZF3_KLEPN